MKGSTWMFQWHLPEGIYQRRDVRTTRFIKVNVQFLPQKAWHPLTTNHSGIFPYSFLTLFSKSGFICRGKAWWLRSDMTFIFTNEETNKSSMTLPQVSSKVSSQVKINDISDQSQHILQEIPNKSHSQHGWIWWRWLNLHYISNPPPREKEIKFVNQIKSLTTETTLVHFSLLPCYGSADLQVATW